MTSVESDDVRHGLVFAAVPAFDGIWTLPAAIAIRDPKVATLLCKASPERTEELAAALQSTLPEAGRMLDNIAAEALTNARYPETPIGLIEQTRALSRQ